MSRAGGIWEPHNRDDALRDDSATPHADGLACMNVTSDPCGARKQGAFFTGSNHWTQKGNRVRGRRGNLPAQHPGLASPALVGANEALVEAARGVFVSS